MVAQPLAPSPYDSASLRVPKGSLCMSHLVDVGRGLFPPRMTFSDETVSYTHLTLPTTPYV